MATSWSPAPTLSATWFNGTLTITVAERAGYTGNYTLQISYDGQNFFTDSAPNTISGGIVTWSLNFPVFDGSLYYRVFTSAEGYPYSTSTVTQPVMGTGGPGVGASQVPCFLGNAPVLTPAGYRRMDSLREGDLVQTPAGETVAIQRVSVTECEAGPATNPYVIPKGRYGAVRNLEISPNHKVAVGGGKMVEARHLGLEQKEREGTLRYYNLELPASENMVVAGVEVESLAHVRRVPVTAAQLGALLTRKYGSAAASSSVLAQVMRTCKVRADGRIDVPVLRK